MSKSEKLSLYLIIFNAAYFASADTDWLKGIAWAGMVGFGVAFIILGKRT